jgi:hypothetical protein
MQEKSKKQKDRIILMQKLFLEGYTPTMVANMVGIHQKSIHYYINKYDLKVINKTRIYHCNDNYFNNIDTEKKAYILGFIIADGHISKENRLCFSNSIDDISIFEEIRSEISPNSKIHLKKYNQGAKTRKEQCILRIKSNILCEQLRDKYNICNNKTHDTKFTFNLDLIPEELKVHFIRGFFDGDGSISFYETKGTIFFNFSFISTSFNFVNQVAQLFENNFKVKKVIRKIQGKTINWFTLRFDYDRHRAREIQKIYEFLYQDATIFLERKRIKFEKYLEYRANPRRKEDRVV